VAAPIKRSRRGGFDLRISAQERDVLVTLPETLRALLVSGDPDDPVLKRLYPSAFIDDEEASVEFDAIVHDDLLEQRLAAIDTMERTSRHSPRTSRRAGGAERRAFRCSVRPPSPRRPRPGLRRRSRGRERLRAYRYLSYPRTRGASPP
jgi:hypothetical protein